MKKILSRLINLFIVIGLLTACSPKIGSPEWCEMIEKKDKGDLTINEAKDYAKHCIFK